MLCVDARAGADQLVEHKPDRCLLASSLPNQTTGDGRFLYLREDWLFSPTVAEPLAILAQQLRKEASC